MNVRTCQNVHLNFKFQISYIHAVIECPVLDDPPNGMVRLEDTVPGSMAFYMCSPGFMPEGDRVRVCELVGERNAQWSGEDPTCTSRFHPSLLNSNSALFLNSNSAQQNFFQIQILHFIVYTQEILVEWCVTILRSFPLAITCPPLEDPANGSVTITVPPPFLVGVTAVYLCDPGFESTGGSILRICGADGTWGGTAPRCVRKWSRLAGLS